MRTLYNFNNFLMSDLQLLPTDGLYIDCHAVYWYDILELRNTILSKSNNINVEIVIVQDTNNDYRYFIKNLDDLEDLYFGLREKWVAHYDAQFDTVEGRRQWMYERDSAFSNLDFEDFLEEVFFSGLDYTYPSFSFTDGEETYYPCLHITKKEI